MKFYSKSKTLKILSKKIKSAVVLPQFTLSIKDWYKNNKNISKIWLNRENWTSGELIVRSSSRVEDNKLSSNAGKFITIKNVKGESNLNDAVRQVIISIEKEDEFGEIFIQPMLKNIKLSGVAFTRDPNNDSNYYVINYDTSDTNADNVTSGKGENLKLFLHSKKYNLPKIIWKRKLINLLKELESLFNNDALDIEFAIDKKNTLYLFQVRPLVIKKTNEYNSIDHNIILKKISNKVGNLIKPHPYLLGDKTIFGIMPDWNPAEILGIRPRPLAVSLYKELITDGTWAYQRGNYGYRNLRSFPLIFVFGGLPYIDVRVSFNSFIPKNLNNEIGHKLVNFYLQRLCDDTTLHDKVEFEIVFSCFTLDIKERISILTKHGFHKNECVEIINSLHDLTSKIIDEKNGLWKTDIQKLTELQIRQKKIYDSNLTLVEKIYWLIQDCKRYGTLPFAGLARAGFIAVQFLQSLVNKDILSTEDYDLFMSSLNTVNMTMKNDIKLGKIDFLKKYGHLRPGTYDIRVPRYDECPELYFEFNNIEKKTNKTKSRVFSLKSSQKKIINKLLIDNNFNHDYKSIFHFIKQAIEGREYAKFIFTKSLSDVLKLLKEIGTKYKLSVDDLSFLDISIINQLYGSSLDEKNTFSNSVKFGKKMYEQTRLITLPSIITSKEEIFSFELSSSQPSFITQKVIQGFIEIEGNKKENLYQKILMINSADPGFDWIFQHNIKGFITKYGGVNSHMAIRAGELQIPAVIGAGEILFNKWKKAKVLNIDCSNKLVNIVK